MYLMEIINTFYQLVIRGIMIFRRILKLMVMNMQMNEEDYTIFVIKNMNGVVVGSTVQKFCGDQKSKKHQDFIKNNLIINNGESL